MTDKVIGLLVAKDKEDYIGMVIDSVQGLIDEMIFIDDLSMDNTVEMVRSRSARGGIKLHLNESTAEAPRRRLWEEALELGKKAATRKGWFFVVDPDTVVNNAVAIRKMTGADRDEQWFKSLNLCGDMVHDVVGSMNKPSLMLFRSSLDVEVDGMGYRTMGGPRVGDSAHFIGWNLSGLQYADSIFQDYQRWFAHVWNLKHDTDMPLTEFMTMFFNRKETGEPSESYMKVFVLNRLRLECKRPFERAGELGMDEAEFRENYMIFPSALENYDCQFELLMDGGGEIIGRDPDLMATSILDDSQIYQLSNLEKYRGWLDE